MQKNNKYNDQYALITGDNDNVGSTSDLKDFFILVAWVVFAVLVFLISFQSIANFVIDRISVDTQVKIEKMLGSGLLLDVPQKYKNKIDELYDIEEKIIRNDSKIQHKENFPLYVMSDKNINACVYPNGNIVFTSALLDENLSEEELAFILAHEIGHYSHRDHLKSVSKQLAVMSVLILLGRNDSAASFVKNISNIENMHHSKKQESAADLYAGEMLFKLYGTNQGGIDAMKLLLKKQQYPEFLLYLSDHPRTAARIEELEKQKQKLLK